MIKWLPPTFGRGSIITPWQPATTYSREFNREICYTLTMGRKSTLMTADPYHIPGYEVTFLIVAITISDIVATFNSLSTELERRLVITHTDY